MKLKKKHKYEYDVDYEHDTAPARVIELVKPGSKVLEIGAGPGSISKHISGKLGCDLVALEIDAAAIKKLKSFSEKIYSNDLNDPSWAGLIRQEQGKFDYVIAADVLEHVYDPWAVLGGMKSLLNEGGSVILSLPHVGHAAVCACLFDEDFEYRDWGLLDRTHVRFFGIKNMQALYLSQGLAIEDAHFVTRTPAMTEFAKRWKRLPKAARDAFELNRFSHVYQVVCRAVPAERAKRSLLLVEQDVPPVNPSTEKYWTDIMAALSNTSSQDDEHIQRRSKKGIFTWLRSHRTRS